jgi:hypothetical protein
MASIGAGGEYFIKDESGKDVKLQEFLTSYQGREEDLKKFLEVQQADEGKSYEQQMLDAQEDIAKVARMQLDAYTKTTQLGLAAEAAMPMAVAGSEFAQQMLAVNTDLSEKIYRPIIDNLGPKSDTVQAFNKAGKGLEEVVEELKKENPDFDKILTKVETTVAEVGVELAGAVGKTIKDISAPLGGLLKEMGVDIDLIIDALGVKVNEIITDIQTKYPSIESSVLEGLNKYKEQFENMLDEFEIEKQIESLIEKVKTATPTDMTQLMQMYETLKNSIPPDMVTGVQDVMTKLEDALRGGGVTLPPTIPPTGGGGVNLPPTIPNNIQVPPTIPNNIQLPPTIPNNIQLPPTIQIQSSPSLNQQPITNVEPANTNVSKEETLKLNTTSTLDGMTEALKYYSASPSLQVTIVGDKTKEINTVEGKNLSELEQTINNQNQTVTNSMIATTQDLNNLNDTIQNTTSQSSLFANESSNSVTEFFNQQTRQQSESNNFANQSINNLSESIGDQFQQVVNQNNTNNQVSTNLNNGVGVTVAEIPAPQISNQTILTPSPAAINPLEIPKAENLLQNGIMTYGGEVKISHELEIKVSSTDGKLKGDEIGKLLTAELKKDNKLVNDIKNQIGSNASFGVTSSPKAISEPQFGK